MSQHRLTIEILPEVYAVARLEPDSEIPRWAENGDLVSVTRTRDELSVVCDEVSVPSNVKARRGFRCLHVLGPLDFDETGILESLASPLARAGISIFALSTYDTDYLLLPAKDLETARAALMEAGHVVGEEGSVE
jgi:hypothetical protein